MKGWKYNHGPEAYAQVGGKLLCIRTAASSVQAIGVAEQSAEWQSWAEGHCTQVTEEEFKAIVQPVLDELKEVMGGAVGIEEVRALRQAQRDYYACKFPDQKHQLLKQARALEDRIDKLLKRMEPPAFPLFPPPAPGAIA